MTRLCIRLVFAAVALLAATQANAHPHVFVTMMGEITFDASGAPTGIRYAWTFDDMFSTYATQGLDSKEKGKFTREELAPLAEVNITSMKEFDYFTVARANGEVAEFGAPKEYYLDFTDGQLTLHFTLPLKQPVKTKSLDIEVYDSTYFVDFSFKDKAPVRLTGAPAACALNIARPGEASPSGPAKGESFFNNLGRASNYGAQFANKISVKCP